MWLAMLKQVPLQTQSMFLGVPPGLQEPLPSTRNTLHSHSHSHSHQWRGTQTPPPHLTLSVFFNFNCKTNRNGQPPPPLQIRAGVSPNPNPNQEEIVSNAERRKRDPNWRGGFSLGIDLGMSRTGLALSKGFSPKPLTVLELNGQKLELRLLEIAQQEEVDEFIIGLPLSSDGKETPQSNKVRSIAGRLAVRAADRGWRVYLQDEHGTSTEALHYMIDTGLKKSARQGRVDAYAAMVVLERYFSLSGQGAEIVLPKQFDLQERIRRGPPKDLDFYPEELDI